MNGVVVRATRRLVFLTAAVMIAPMLTAAAAAAEPERGEGRVLPPQERSVAGKPVPVWPTPQDAAMRAAKGFSPAVSWPVPGAATVDLSAVRGGMRRAGGLPVWVAPASGGARGPAPAGRVRVELLPKTAATRAGVDGFLVTLASSGAEQPVTVEIGYGSFKDAYGADWASRLRLVRLPNCTATHPQRQACQTATAVSTHNDTATRRLRAGVTVGGEAEPSVFAVTAAASGGAGSYRATPLSPSALWQVSAQTGDFSWTYPVRVPPAGGGPAPEVNLSYASGGVDGRTASTNNQPSWIGEGFDFWPGYVERRYKGCADDKSGGNNANRTTGDLCWSTSNATLVLNGRASELVRDDTTGAWRAKNDDGSRIRLLSGAVNGDDNGEHWEVTTTDGTRYYFGRHRLPGWTDGKTETASTWTVPVFGNHPGEPCHATAFSDSWCQQGWRWNLDYVIDPHGNVMSLYYQREQNRYARNITASAGTTYHRGGNLLRIDYGQRDGQVYTTPAPARVVFTAAERCLPGSTCDPAKPSDWPDTPWDQHCATASCPDQWSPTFWTQKRLAKVTTQVWRGQSFADVGSWALKHTFPAPGDGTSAALWLESIVHTGHVGGTVSLPEVNFDGVQMVNRVDAQEGLPPLNKWRITGLTTETGGYLSVTYSAKQCVRGSNMPAALDTNTKRCFPQYWTPEGASSPYLDYFHKYLATSVSQVDRTGGSPTQVTSYSYLGTPAWHYTDDPLVPDEYRTWSQWRGYSKVRTIHGDPNEQRSQTEQLFFRGMDGDRLASGAVKDVKVTDSEAVQVDDHWRYNGYVREEIVHNGPGGAEVSGTINDPWLSGATATRGSTQALMLDTAKVRGRTALTGGTYRRVQVNKTFDQYGVPVNVTDYGDTSTSADNRCTRYSYARNTGAWMLTYASQIETFAAACTLTPSYPADAISDVRTYYDNKPLGDPPTRGDATKVEKAADYTSGVPSYVTVSRQIFDDYGRVTDVYDAAGNHAHTSYTPATGGPVTEVTTTNPLGHTHTTQIEPAWGVPVAEVDANLRRTDLQYDPLGRLSKVWLPGQTKPGPATAEYGYAVRRDGPLAVSTKSLKPDGGYLTSFELYDSWLRPRQTQVPAPGGGRTVADTEYDSRGLVAQRNMAYYNAAAPDAFIIDVPDTEIPSQTLYSYDGAARPTTEVFRVKTVEKWRTTVSYGGDRIHVDPPDGGTATTTIQDARGRTVELRQYATSTPTGTSYDATRYTYTRAGQLDTVTDPAGNTWRYIYDPRGRLTTTVDPDRGTTRHTYNDLDQLVTTTDSLDRTIANVYDNLGRVTETHSGSTTGPPLTSRVYDTLLKGYPTSATRHNGDATYTTEVTGYDTANRPLGSRITIPLAEGLLAGTYTYNTTYNPDSSVATLTYPAAGGLAPEVLTFGYDDVGLPATLTGLAPYVTDSLYTKLAEPMLVELGTDKRSIALLYWYQEGTRRLTQIRADKETLPGVWENLADTRYGYDPAGNITRATNLAPGQVTDTQCFDYDHLRRVTDAWTVTNSATTACDTAPTQAAIGGPAPYWHSYSYDKTGNRLTEKRHHTTGDVTSAYTYPAAGQPQPHTLQSVTTTGPSGTSVDRYSYDTAGNTATRQLGGDTQQLEWDTEGHLTKVTEGTETTSFVYDADGNRLLRKDPDGTTLYLGPTEVRVDKTTNATSARRYYSHGSALAVRGSDGSLNWQVGDNHGTVNTTINALTLDVTRRRFTAFGEPRGQAPLTWPDERGFVGGTTDTSTGLTHLGAREYHPGTGRFLSVDPIIDHGDPQQMHGYAYANNSPATFSDADGLKPTCANDPAQEAACQKGSNGGGSSGGGGSGNPSQDQINLARDIKNKDFNKVLIDVGADLLLDILGINDIRNCFSKGDAGACTSMIIGFLPWGKILKGGAAIGKAIYRGVKAYLRWQHELKWASRILSKADEATAAVARTGGGASRYADNAAAAGARHTDDAASAAARRADNPPAGAGPSCPVGNSFTPDTEVVMADGTTQPIEDVQIGDKVLATDPETGETKPQEVVALIEGDGLKHLVEVTIDTDGDNGDDTGTIVATDRHPFWADDQEAWIDAKNLKPGHLLRTSAGNYVQVTAIKHRHTISKVHNLTVANTHTYHVATNNTDTLVHNCGGLRNNRYPELLDNELATADKLGVSPLVAGTGAFSDAVAAGGRYIWAVTGDGTLKIAPALGNVKHTVLTRGGPVQGAGEVVFGRGGAVTAINNSTGHYTPTCRCGADLQRGVDAFMSAGVPVMMRGITRVGW